MNQFVDSIEVRTGASKACHYVGLSSNGEVLFTSETFDSRNNCLRAAADLSDDFVEEVPVTFGAVRAEEPLTSSLDGGNVVEARRKR